MFTVDLDCRRERSGSSSTAITRVLTALLAMVSGMCTTYLSWVFFIRAYVNTESGGLNVAMTPQEESAEDGFGHDVKDTVEHGFRVGRDDIAALGESPGNRV